MSDRFQKYKCNVRERLYQEVDSRKKTLILISCPSANPDQADLPAY